MLVAAGAEHLHHRLSRIRQRRLEVNDGGRPQDAPLPPVGYAPAVTTHHERPGRPIHAAELLAVGSELTAGETRDTNGGELARALSLRGVTVRRITALPDDLARVTAAFGEALADVDLVVATGGLGPTPDDLTREALAAAIGEVPAVDPAQEAWLRALFERRGMALPEVNLKQAWLIPSATAIPNPNGTAPGWWVERPDGRIAVLLPGPPRELRAMWRDWVVPRLLERGLGDGRVVRTLRTYGIGESHVAELLGEDDAPGGEPGGRHVRPGRLARRADLRGRRHGRHGARHAAGGRGAAGRRGGHPRDPCRPRAHRRRHVLGGPRRRGDGARGVRFAIVEAGTHGSLGALLAEVPSLEREVAHGPAVARDVAAWPVEDEALAIARDSGVDIGLALVAHTDGSQTLLRAAVAAPDAGWSRVLDLRLFQHGPHGRFRAGVAAAAFLVEVLGEER